MSLPTPVAYWPLDESTGATSADASGHAHTLAVDESLSDWVTGKFGNALSQLQTATGLAASFAAIDLGTVYSVALWSLWQDPSDGVLVAGAPGSYAFYLDGTAIYHSAGTGNFVTVAYVPTASWRHLVVTRNGATVRFYVDGAALGAAQTLATPATTLVLSGIGAFNALPFDFAAKGLYDDIRLYDVTLSAAQVSELFALDPTAPVTTGTALDPETTLGLEPSFVAAAVGGRL